MYLSLFYGSTLTVIFYSQKALFVEQKYIDCISRVIDIPFNKF